LKLIYQIYFPVAVVFLFILFSSTSWGQSGQNPSLAEIREKIPTAFEDEKACSALLKKYKTVENPETILKGYIGGLYIARSRHAPLLDKMSALKTGTSMLEEAIYEEPGNIELLFLRLTIQLNLPSFLGYNDNVTSDKFFVLSNYKSAPPILKKRILNFINTSGYFNEQEKLKITE